MQRPQCRKAPAQRAPLCCTVASEALQKAVQDLQHNRAAIETQGENPNGGTLVTLSDIDAYCARQGISRRVRGIAKAAFRAPSYDAQLHANVWRTGIYQRYGNAARSLLEADERVSAENSLNGGRQRINALLFAYGAEQEVAQLGASPNREKTVLNRLAQESGKPRKRVQLLLQRGKWCALWLKEFGFGGLLALGDTLACGDHITYDDIPTLAAMCRAMTGFREKARGFQEAECKSVAQAVEGSDLRSWIPGEQYEITVLLTRSQGRGITNFADDAHDSSAVNGIRRPQEQTAEEAEGPERIRHFYPECVQAGVWRNMQAHGESAVQKKTYSCALGCKDHAQAQCSLSDDVRLLSLMLAFAQLELPQGLFDMVRRAHGRWNCNGSISFATLSDTSIKDDMKRMLLSDRLETALNNLHAQQIIRTHFASDGSEVYILPQDAPASQACPNVHTERSRAEAVKLLCFIAPRDKILTTAASGYTTLIVRHERIISIMKSTLDQCAADDLDDSLRIEVADVLLSASSRGSLLHRTDVFKRAMSHIPQSAPFHLRAYAAYQESVLHRLRGDHDSSAQVLYPWLVDYTDGQDGRSNATSGLIHVSQLENLIQSESYMKAIREIDKWRANHPPSLMESRILPMRALSTAKILRAQGRFRNIIGELSEPVLTSSIEPNRYRLLCALADAYVDLGELDRARSTLQSEIDLLRSRGYSARNKALRRLIVSSIDIHFASSEDEAAILEIEELQSIYHAMIDIDISDQLLNIRRLITSAKIKHRGDQILEAVREWDDVLAHAQKYTSFATGGFTHVAVHLSQSQLFLACGTIEQARSSFDCATRITYRQDHWIPILAQWVEQIKSDLKSRQGWDFRSHAQMADSYDVSISTL